MKTHPFIFPGVFLLSFLISGIYSTSKGQSFRKGNHYLNAGSGIGIYKVNTQIGEKIFSRGAGSLLFPFHYEYSLLDQVGLGLQFQKNFYFSPDSSMRSRAGANTFLFSNTLHFFNKNVVDPYLGIAYGLSTYNYSAQNEAQSKTQLKGAGFSYLVYTGIKMYFNERAGVFFSACYNNLSYEIHTFRIDNKNEMEFFRNNYNVNYSGVNLQGGIVIQL